MARLTVLLIALCALAPALALPQAHGKGPRLAVAQGKAKAPGKVLAKKTRPVVPPVRVGCTYTTMNPPYRVAKCVAVSRLPRPACVALYCAPDFSNACASGPNLQSMQNQECAWNINQGCRSPIPLMPNQPWEFGFMTADPRPHVVKLFNYTLAGAAGGTCPTLH